MSLCTMLAVLALSDSWWGIITLNKCHVEMSCLWYTMLVVLALTDFKRGNSSSKKMPCWSVMSLAHHGCSVSIGWFLIGFVELCSGWHSIPLIISTCKFLLDSVSHFAKREAGKKNKTLQTHKSKVLIQTYFCWYNDNCCLALHACWFFTQEQ